MATNNNNNIMPLPNLYESVNTVILTKMYPSETPQFEYFDRNKLQWYSCIKPRDY